MGKTIRIYLPNQTVAGIRHAEIVNWTGQALACPRSRFHELKDWPQVDRPGVYFLFGADDDTGESVVYIGEAEVVIERLSTHFSGKDFWTDLVAFTNKDENLTKAHVRYLESKFITLAQDAGRYKLTNTASPQLPLLPRSDCDAMDEYLESAKMLLGVLGHKVLEKLVAKQVNPALVQPLDPMQKIASYLEAATAGNVQTTTPIFFLKSSGLIARAVGTDEGVVVLEDSQAAQEHMSSLTGGLLALRTSLIQSGVLVPFGDKLRFARDYLFKSPSQAAGIVVGYSINGPKNWRLEDGTTYTQYEGRAVDAMINESIVN